MLIVPSGLRASFFLSLLSSKEATDVPGGVVAVLLNGSLILSLMWIGLFALLCKMPQFVFV